MKPTIRLISTREAVAWYERKMKALEAGEFDVTNLGELMFREDDLKRANY